MLENKTDDKIPLIIACSGKTGKRVAARFRAHGLNFRAGSRQGQVPFDWYDASTWPQVLAGISSVYIVFYPDLAVFGAPEIILEFTKVAKACGVEHLVLLSGRGEPEAQTCEKIVMDSTLDWTIVRSSWFAQNFSESFFLGDILRDQVVIPSAEVPGSEVREPFIDAEDIADVVFAVLTEDKHKNKIYEITGPALMTFREAIIEIGKASERKIEFQQIPMDDYVQLLTEAEVPQDYIALIKYLFTEVLDGRNAHVTDGVTQALGREARSFPSYAKATAETGIWNATDH